MLRRVENGDYVLPISKTTPLSTSASSMSFEVLGFVESYSALGTCGFGQIRDRFMDKSGRVLSSVLMLSRSVKKVLAIAFVVDKFNILLDDGLVISGGFDVSVDIHCDDISCSELLTTDWRHHFLCQNIDGEVMIPFSTLLVQLKKKLQLQLTNEELDLYNLSAIDAEDENEELVLHHQQSKVFPTKPKHELEEVALHDYSLLFPTPWEYEVGPSTETHQCKRSYRCGALAAAVTGLETGDLSAATPLVLAAACALADSPSVLHDACTQSAEPCRRSDRLYEERCLGLFRGGESKFPSIKDRQVTVAVPKANFKFERVTEQEKTYKKDCCNIISSPCLCEMKKTLINEGKVPPAVGCLNAMELETCKP
ncbi:hypothetical protein BAE44_0004763 [Dichanthelium oligosanthes]|uniref:Uncharacterized protein n=1 Tax=Dichanthelium oligosanthes TaxID=888268 RepID=A0A1E5WAE7_9POAL|nr:hypothetical protein BAE44_0004763 [Dichanthelium oligosanthes]